VEAVERKESGNGPVRLRRTGKVAATVKIEKHDVAGRRAFKPFAGDTTETSRRDFDCWRNFVGIGVQDFARDAKIPHTFQTTLNAPFNDPDGESRLKAGHYVPLSDLREIQDERIADIDEN